jgi:hypothetical protein
VASLAADARCRARLNRSLIPTNEKPGARFLARGSASAPGQIEAFNLKTFSETLQKSRASIADHAQKNDAQFPISARECIRCERDKRHSQSIIRIVRLKSDSCGDLRTAGPLIEFAKRHLSSVIAMLQHMLQRAEGGSLSDE